MTLINWLTKKLGQDYEARIANLKEAIQALSNLNGHAHQTIRDLEEKLEQAKAAVMSLTERRNKDGKEHEKKLLAAGYVVDAATDLATSILARGLQVHQHARPEMHEVQVVVHIGPAITAVRDANYLALDTIRKELAATIGIPASDPAANFAVNHLLDSVMHEIEDKLFLDRCRQADPFDSAEIRCAGMDINTIIELRRQYLRLGGPFEITAKNVRELFLNFYPPERCHIARYERYDPGSNVPARHMGDAIRYLAPERKPRDASPLGEIPQAPGGVVLPDPDPSTLP